MDQLIALVPTEYIHWIAFACMLASLILRVVPKPKNGGTYLVAYNVLRWLAANRGYKVVRNGR